MASTRLRDLIRRPGVLALLFVVACSHKQQPEQTRAASSYVDPKLCAACHASHWESFRQTGMGRSFYRATAASMAGQFHEGAAYYHKPSDRYYQMLRRGDTFFQRRYQKDPTGAETNVVETSVDYVMGSGNHARTYIHRTAQIASCNYP